MTEKSCLCSAQKNLNLPCRAQTACISFFLASQMELLLVLVGILSNSGS